jgi:glycosyltransferase involved in cell wall biosynthesis
MTHPTLAPDHVFESNWEVCNKVGGIYTVLSTRAKSLQSLFPNRIIFVGPDLKRGSKNTDFIEDPALLKDWKKQALAEDNLRVRTGHWDVPGLPITVLVDFAPYYKVREDIYYRMWERFGIDSTVGYGDYDEASIFAYAAGRTIESLHRFLGLQNKRVVAHLHEWMMGMAVLYLRDRVPNIATIFTTHATSVGRSICGNEKPLYGELSRYDGDQMAHELNIEGKHRLEKTAAQQADCFTTVSKITARECQQLLNKKPDIITPNGFEPDFVPRGYDFDRRRQVARRVLRTVTEQLTGRAVKDSALLVATSGRYEYRNKGIDLFIEALNRVRLENGDRQIVAFVMVPAEILGPRKDLQNRLKRRAHPTEPLPNPVLTHQLADPDADPVCNYFRYLNVTNNEDSPVRLLFVPSYLNGDDGIFNLPYYHLLMGIDLTVFPSYYEPWGYTPLESIAFHVPTITTQLAGFGRWAEDHNNRKRIHHPEPPAVTVVERTDDNYFEAADAIKRTILRYAETDPLLREEVSKEALLLARKANWAHFIRYYLEAYSIALHQTLRRKK